MNLRILLSSEDTSLMVNLTAQARAIGEKITVASSISMLDQARLMSPDLLIVDIQQRIDGRLLIARLKQDTRTSFLRIAAISGRDDDKVHRFCREHHVTSYSLKPVMTGFLERELAPLREARGFAWAAGR